MINAMKNPFVNILGHPDDGRIPVGLHWNCESLGPLRGVLIEGKQLLAQTHLIQINATENIKDYLKSAKNNVYIIINSDSHIHTDIGGIRRSPESGPKK